MSGISLQEKLANANFSVPVISLTGHADEPMAGEAMTKGAVGFLQKPPRSNELL
jgi:two-component system response regulator FixJ